LRVIFGLGNPGRSYQLTRHNIGFILLDHIQGFSNIPFRPGKGDYYYCDLRISDERVMLVKPTTYMNNSGLAVAQFLNYYKVDLSDALIVYDDYHLPFATLRFRGNGSAGGHNGVKSIIAHLGTQQFDRLRIGIGDQFKDSVNFVLSKFTKKELSILEDLLPEAYNGIKVWLASGLDAAMNQYNRSFNQ
jgi:PTH1 family peptidyl-tRNA hydrolase